MSDRERNELLIYYSCLKRFLQLYAMNIFPSTRSLMQGTIQPNIKSLSIIHFFVRYFVPPQSLIIKTETV